MIPLPHLPFTQRSDRPRGHSTTDDLAAAHGLSRHRCACLRSLHCRLQNIRGGKQRLFFLFLAQRKRRSIAELSLKDIQAEAVLSFLDYAETQRGNSPTSRNSRLAALRSFAQHLLRHDIASAHQYGRILAIPSKRAPVRVVSFLEPEEARAVIAAVEARTPLAARDRALLLFLYNTGARVSEALAVHARQLRLDRPRQVRVLGKGGKERVCPLWPETAAALRQLVRTNA